MAQHDYVINNSTGQNVRQDINNALQAIVTNNSGSSAPSSTFPFMLFADSAAGTMKIRNAADNAFIELFQLDGTFTLEDGSASTPGLAFRDDLNTGIFSGGADEFNIATGGTERLMINSDGLTVQKGVTVTGIEGGDAQIRLKADEGDDNNDTYRLLVADGGTGFQIQSFNGSFNTRLIIDSSGNVGIGTTSPDGKLSVTGDIVCNSGTIRSNDGFVSDADLIFNADANANGGNSIIFKESNSEKMRIHSSGNVEISDGNLILASGHGIDFSATGDSAGSTSDEILADYEKGSWTPVFSDASSSGNTASSYNVQKGWYARMGDLVNVFMRLSNITFSGFNTSHAVFITGLPFTIQADVGRLCTGHAMTSNVNLDDDTMTIGVLANPGSVNTSHFRLFQTKDNAVWAQIVVSQFTSGNNEIMINFSYLTP